MWFYENILNFNAFVIKDRENSPTCQMWETTEKTFSEFQDRSTMILDRAACHEQVPVYIGPRARVNKIVIWLYYHWDIRYIPGEADVILAWGIKAHSDILMIHTYYESVLVYIYMYISSPWNPQIPLLQPFLWRAGLFLPLFLVLMMKRSYYSSWKLTGSGGLRCFRSFLCTCLSVRRI